MRGIIVVGQIQFHTIRVKPQECKRQVDLSQFKVSEYCYDKFFSKDNLEADDLQTNMMWKTFRDSDSIDYSFFIYGNNGKYNTDGYYMRLPPYKTTLT